MNTKKNPILQSIIEEYRDSFLTLALQTNEILSSTKWTSKIGTFLVGAALVNTILFNTHLIQELPQTTVYEATTKVIVQFEGKTQDLYKIGQNLNKIADQQNIHLTEIPHFDGLPSKTLTTKYNNSVSYFNQHSHLTPTEYQTVVNQTINVVKTDTKNTSYSTTLNGMTTYYKHLNDNYNKAHKIIAQEQILQYFDSSIAKILTKYRFKSEDEFYNTVLLTELYQIDPNQKNQETIRKMFKQTPEQMVNKIQYTNGAKNEFLQFLANTFYSDTEIKINNKAYSVKGTYFTDGKYNNKTILSNLKKEPLAAIETFLKLTQSGKEAELTGSSFYNEEFNVLTVYLGNINDKITQSKFYQPYGEYFKLHSASEKEANEKLLKLELFHELGHPISENSGLVFKALDKIEKKKDIENLKDDDKEALLFFAKYRYAEAFSDIYSILMTGKHVLKTKEQLNSLIDVAIEAREISLIETTSDTASRIKNNKEQIHSPIFQGLDEDTSIKLAQIIVAAEGHNVIEHLKQLKQFTNQPNFNLKTINQNTLINIANNIAIEPIDSDNLQEAKFIYASYHAIALTEQQKKYLHTQVKEQNKNTIAP